MQNDPDVHVMYDDIDLTAIWEDVDWDVDAFVVAIEAEGIIERHAVEVADAMGRDDWECLSPDLAERISLQCKEDN